MASLVLDEQASSYSSPVQCLAICRYLQNVRSKTIIEKGGLKRTEPLTVIRESRGHALMVEVPTSIINGWTKGVSLPKYLSLGRYLVTGALWLVVAIQRLRTVDDLGHAAASGRAPGGR